MGHKSDPQVHDYLRHREFGVRLPHFWPAIARPSCNAGPIQDRMVPGIRRIGVIDRARYSKQETFLQEQAGKIFTCYNTVDFCRDADFAVHPACGTIRVQPAAGIVFPVHRAYRIVVHRHGRNDEEGFLQEGEILN